MSERKDKAAIEDLMRVYRNARHELLANENRIRKVIRELEDASFACGEWTRDESDESYAEVMERQTKARRALFAAIGLSADKGETK